MQLNETKHLQSITWQGRYKDREKVSEFIQEKSNCRNNVEDNKA